MVLASWCIWLGFPDPAEDLRGTYTTDEELPGIIEVGGGLVNVVGSRLLKIGFREVHEPTQGSIGVIGSRSAGSDKQFGAIFTGEFWVVRFINGFGRMAAPQLAAWSPK